MPPRLNIIGERYGKLLVIDEGGPMNGCRRVNCKCDCGTVVLVRVSNLTCGNSKCCGCVHARNKHGHTTKNGRSPTYSSWCAMRNRCETKSNVEWHNYGGRGIAVCARWATFENFLADMGVRPKGTSIDRIDVDGNYEPGNCRWATSTEQGRNKRDTKLTPDLVNEIHGRYDHGESGPSIARRMGVSAAHIHAIRSGEKWPEFATP